jgi:hypothetical protein
LRAAKAKSKNGKFSGDALMKRIRKTKEQKYDRFDDLVFKSAGAYKNIVFKNVVLKSLTTKEDGKCKLCYFEQKPDVCDIIPCSSVIYVKGK